MSLFISSVLKINIWQYVFIYFKLLWSCRSKIATPFSAVNYFTTFSLHINVPLIMLCAPGFLRNWFPTFASAAEGSRNINCRVRREGCSPKLPKTVTLHFSVRQQNEWKYKNSQTRNSVMLLRNKQMKPVLSTTSVRTMPPYYGKTQQRKHWFSASFGLTKVQYLNVSV